MFRHVTLKQLISFTTFDTLSRLSDLEIMRRSHWVTDFKGTKNRHSIFRTTRRNKLIAQGERVYHNITSGTSDKSLDMVTKGMLGLGDDLHSDKIS